MTRQARNWNLGTWDLRPIWIGVAAMMLIAFVVESAFLYRVIDDQTALFVDHRYYVDVAHRWLDSGVFYTDRQLSGPYQTQTLVDNLYPPHALYLFIPFTILPAILWWVIPLGLMAYVVWWCRPQPIGLVAIGLLLLFPKTPNLIIYGNTDMWVGAAIAGGIRWGWPAVLVSFKPSLIFFGVVGIRTRRWWIAAGVVFLLCLPLASLWTQYPTILANSSSRPWYSFSVIPFLLIPIVGWLFSARRGEVPMHRWALALLGRMDIELEGRAPG